MKSQDLLILGIVGYLAYKGVEGKVGQALAPLAPFTAIPSGMGDLLGGAGQLLPRILPPAPQHIIETTGKALADIIPWLSAAPVTLGNYIPNISLPSLPSLTLPTLPTVELPTVTIQPFIEPALATGGAFLGGITNWLGGARENRIPWIPFV